MKNASPQCGGSGKDGVAKVPSVRVKLLQSVRVPSGQSTLVSVHLQGCKPSDQPMLLERDPSLEESTGLQIADALVQATKEGVAYLCIANPPKRQPIRRMPFAARTKIAKQLKDMQHNGVIQPSK